MSDTDTKEEIISRIAEHYEAILRLIGEDPTREGLQKTPIRAAKALYFTTSGYKSTTDEIVNGAIFTHEGSKMIIVKDIEFYSFCEHHILPFYGRISVGYIPDGKIIGLSKIARLVNMYARRLQVQERLTAQVCDEVRRVLGAKGVIVRCEGAHLCMKMRGVEKQDSTTVTTEYNGVFETSESLRSEFFNAIG